MNTSPAPTTGTTPVPWLDDDQQRAWRGWMFSHTRLQAALARSLQEESGLSDPDFVVLVSLTDVADGRRRVTELADTLGWERSRVSHHVTRMEQRGLVERQACPKDARGAFVAVTAHGRATIEAAAPHHVRLVRDLFVDVLTPEELAQVEAISAKVMARVAERR